MKVTVITPCFNPGKYLKPMLESVAANGAFVTKHIVMDGGSTDGSVDVLRKWAAEHPWFEFVSERDDGQSDACRKALEKVETEYFFWLNADDVMLPRALESLAACCEGHPAIVYGDYLRIDGEGKTYARRPQPSYDYWSCLRGYLFVQNVAAIFNAPLLRRCGGFDVSLRFAMDYDIILKLGRVGPVRHVRKYCGSFRVHGTSKTSTIDDVCQKETDGLRTRYGLTENRLLRTIGHKFAKIRVAFRMLREGVIWERFR